MGAYSRGSRLIVFNMVLIAGLAVAGFVWLPFSPVRISLVFFLAGAISVAPLALLWAVLAAMRLQLRRMRFRYRDTLSEFARRIQALVVALGSIVILSVGLLLLTYLASATRSPLMDAYLATGDAALGFKWGTYVGRLNDHPWVASALSWAYFTLKAQLFLLPAILAMTGRSTRLQEFVAFFGLSGCLTCLVMMAVPAAGAFDFYHPASDILNSFAPGASTRHLEQFHALRTLKPFLLDRPEGLVTFPSFHSALAAIFVYSARGIRYVAALVYLLNAMLILATPAEGGHYLVDILAGFAVAAVSIYTVGWIARAGAPKQTGYGKGKSQPQGKIPWA